MLHFWNYSLVHLSHQRQWLLHSPLSVLLIPADTFDLSFLNPSSQHPVCIYFFPLLSNNPLLLPFLQIDSTVFLKLQKPLRLHVPPALNSFLYSPKRVVPFFLTPLFLMTFLFLGGCSLMLEVHESSSPLLSTLVPYRKSPPESSWAPPILTPLSHPIAACLGRLLD